MARKTSFYYSFLVLPAEQRQAIVAVWDFCRAVDDAVDEDRGRGNHAARREAVAFWRAELARAFDGSAPSTPQAQHLQPFIAAFDLPRQAFDDVIDGVAMDLDTARYETFDDLFEYCRRVASAVGLICIRIFGCRNDRVPGIRRQPRRRAPAHEHPARHPRRPRARPRVSAARRSGGARLRRRRSGEGRRDRAGAPPDGVRVRPRARFLSARHPGRPDEDRRRLVAAEIMRAVYFETLRRIERNGYDVFSGRVRVQRPMQAFIAVRQLIQSLGHPVT